MTSVPGDPALSPSAKPLHRSCHPRHLQASDSVDGEGPLYSVDSTDSNSTQSLTPNSLFPPAGSPPTEVLPASCYCGRISLTITRPTRASLAPHSNYPDLLLPYCTTSPSVISNPESIKWWLRDSSPSAYPPHSDAQRHPSPESLEKASDEDLSRYRYLAGTCACRSCRLTSGFEIQTWAFIPRCNILVNVPSPSTPGAESMSIPLDFSTLPGDLLKSYRSSAAAVRESCPTCGATVFWHDAYRPDLIDVSAGIFDCPSGSSRVESFLSWWTGRVSFSEEARTERTGFVATWAQHLITRLEKGAGAR